MSAVEGRVPVTVVVLTYNEERNLGSCLESVVGWTRRVCVVDSGSTDATLDIARRHGASVFVHAFDTHAAQWHWALGALAIDTAWVLGLDADQRVTATLRNEIVELFDEQPDRLETVAGFYVNRRQIFRGRWIRHGGYYPKYLLKLFRKDLVYLDVDELVDHHFHVRGPTAKLRGEIVEENRNENDLAFWKAKHRRYAELLAREELRARDRAGRAAANVRPSGELQERAQRRRRWWRRLPLFVRPVLYFLFRMVLQGGWLDGKEGRRFHFLHALWFRWQVDRRLWQLRTSEARE